MSENNVITENDLTVPENNKEKKRIHNSNEKTDKRDCVPCDLQVSRFHFILKQYSPESFFFGFVVSSFDLLARASVSVRKKPRVIHSS